MADALALVTHYRGTPGLDTSSELAMILEGKTAHDLQWIASYLARLLAVKTTAEDIQRWALDFQRAGRLRIE